jgi:hypothetical protein
MSARISFPLAALAALTFAASSQAALWTTGGGLGKAEIAPPEQPLTGTGQNMQIVANVPMAQSASGGPAASDIELAGDYAYVGSYGEGLVIVDISNPEKPVRAGVFNCPGGQNDVQLSPDASYGVMAIDTKNNGCHPQQEGSVILDLRDKAHPKELAFIPIVVGSHNNTLDWPLLYIDNYPTSYHKVEIFSLVDPRHPAKIGQYDWGTGDGIHDSYIDHRPDGTTLLYAGSIGNTDILDVTDPTNPKLKIRFADPEVTISHQAEPNHDRSMMLVTDEWQGGGDFPACGRATPSHVAVDAVPQLPVNPTDIGALYFYGLDKNGLTSGTADKLGTFNLPVGQSDAGCTIHVFWQAPDQDRLVTAWYGRGIHVVDFSDPANAKDIGNFEPTGGDVWSAKPHKGYIFTGDIVRGMDVLKYTGDGWPKTSGPAEAQRPHNGSALAKPSAKAAGTKTGVKRFAFRVRVPRATDSVTLDVRNTSGTLVSRLAMPARAGALQTLRGSAGGLAGRYTYTLRAGSRTLRSGTLTVTGSSASRVKLGRGQVLVCRLF